LVLTEGRAFNDWHRVSEDGKSLWTYVLLSIKGADSPISILSMLLDLGLGSEFAATDQHGWHSLFHYVLTFARRPDSEKEFEVIRALLAVIVIDKDDVFAEDCDDLNIFERVVKRPKRGWVNDNDNDNGVYRGFPGRWYEDSPELQGSYQQDLWYCALLRSGRYSCSDLPRISVPRFTSEYTPRHYRALLYSNWSREGTSLSRYRTSLLLAVDEEREETPGFRDWNLPDLLVMERGLEHAVYELEPWRLYRVYAGFHLTREMYCYRSEDEGTESEWSGDSTAEDQEDPKNDQSNRSSEEGSEPGSGDLASDDSDEED
jgi:hypothetical protein